MNRIKFILEHRKAIIKHLSLIWKYYFINKKEVVIFRDSLIIDFGITNNKKEKELIIKEAKEVLMYNYNDTRNIGSLFISPHNTIIEQKSTTDSNRIKISYKEIFILK